MAVLLTLIAMITIVGSINIIIKTAFKLLILQLLKATSIITIVIAILII